MREARNPVERELLAHDIDAYKEDVFAGAGDGSIGPSLPTVPPDELYEEFERDESEPEERAP
jgi:hypothetical protein